MKLLSFSGAATKIAAHAAHGKLILEAGYTPDIMSGVSSGSLVILPLLLGKHSLLKSKTTELKLKDIFSKNPVNTKGKITLQGYGRGILKGNFGEMNALVDTIKYFCTEEEFTILMKKKSTPIIYFGITNMNAEQFENIAINKLSYSDMIQVLISSASIPLYTPPIKINDSLYYDGGLVYHNSATYVIREFTTLIKEVISVYARPLNVGTYDPAYNGKSLGRNLSKTLTVLQDTISKSNEKSEIDLCKLYNIKLTQKFSPKITKGVYDVNNNRLKALYDLVING